MRALRWCLVQALQPSLLDGVDMLSDYSEPSHGVPDLVERVSVGSAWVHHHYLMD